MLYLHKYLFKMCSSVVQLYVPAVYLCCRIACEACVLRWHVWMWLQTQTILFSNKNILYKYCFFFLNLPLTQNMN